MINKSRRSYVEFPFSFTHTFLTQVVHEVHEFPSALAWRNVESFHPSIIWSRCRGWMCHHETIKTHVDCFYTCWAPVRFEKSQEIWGTKYVNSRYIYIYIYIRIHMTMTYVWSDSYYLYYTICPLTWTWKKPYKDTICKIINHMILVVWFAPGCNRKFYLLLVLSIFDIAQFIHCFN